MTRSLNSATIIGNLGRDPEIRALPTGSKVANFTVATSESWKDKSTGDKKEETTWHRVTVFGPLVDVVEKYIHKGTLVFIRGKLNVRKYTDKEGVERYSTEIVVQGFGHELIILDTKADTPRSVAPAPAAASISQPSAPPSQDIADDEIPF